MINLLHVLPSEDEIARILAVTAGRPALPLLGDPVWRDAGENPTVIPWLIPLTARAGAEAEEPLPAFTDELYGDFFKTGARLPFETVYFERRRRLARAAIAMLLGDEATRVRLLPSFLCKLGEIMDEVSWTLPAHVRSEPTGKDPMQIDLFAAECANNLADMLVVFASVIPAELRQRIKTRLRVQFFENYANRHASFVWSNGITNWNAVCHQGVLGAALAIEDDHALVARLLVLAARGLPHYLGGFGSDGTTSEGPGYWSYGFGWFTELNAQLEHRSWDHLSFFEGDAKIASIARFAPRMAFANGHMVNFSDGSRTGRFSPSMLTYLGKRLRDRALAAEGAALYRLQIQTGINPDETRRDFFNMTRLALRAPSAAILAAAKEPVQPDVFFEDYGVVVARGADDRGHLWEFAVKGGHNDEHHNHNDCGSFLLNIGGAPALIEIGAPEYVGDFFSDRRYTFLAARSLGHSVPIVNGYEQASGREFAATILAARLEGDRVEFVVELAKCYPPEACCRKLRRTFFLEKSSGRLAVSDEFQLDGPGMIESLLICQDRITREGVGAVISSPTSVRVIPTEGTHLAAIDTCDYRGHQGTDEKIQRLRFAPLAGEIESGRLGYEVRIA